MLGNTEFSERLECYLNYETLTSQEVEEHSGRAESLLEVMASATFTMPFPAS